MTTKIPASTRVAYASHANGYEPPAQTEQFPLTVDEVRPYRDAETDRLVDAGMGLLIKGAAVCNDDFELALECNAAAGLLFDAARCRVIGNFLADNERPQIQNADGEPEDSNL